VGAFSRQGSVNTAKVLACYKTVALPARLPNKKESEKK
jgi:hypothetical protein